MKKIKYLVLVLPLSLSAQTYPTPKTTSTFRDIVKEILGVINILFPLVAALALLAFIWGLVKFITHAGDVKTHSDGKQLMIWGIIALFVMVTVLGILNFFSGEVGFGPILIPTLPTGGA